MEKGSTLEIQKGSMLEFQNTSILEIQKGSTLQFNHCSTLEIQNSPTLEIQREFYIWDSKEFQTQKMFLYVFYDTSLFYIPWKHKKSKSFDRKWKAENFSMKNFSEGV